MPDVKFRHIATCELCNAAVSAVWTAVQSYPSAVTYIPTVKLYDMSGAEHNCQRSGTDAVAPA